MILGGEAKAQGKRVPLFPFINWHLEASTDALFG